MKCESSPTKDHIVQKRTLVLDMVWNHMVPFGSFFSACLFQTGGDNVAVRDSPVHGSPGSHRHHGRGRLSVGDVGRQ